MPWTATFSESYKVKFKVLTLIVLKIQVYWDVAPDPLKVPNSAVMVHAMSQASHHKD
jgi:hypothetical protein